MKIEQKDALNHKQRKKRNEKKGNFFKKRNKSAFTGIRLFSNLPIGMKYLIIFLFSVVLFLAATTIVFVQLSTAKKDVQSIIHDSDIANSITEMALLVEQQHAAISSYAIVGNDRHIESYDRMAEKMDDIFNKLDDVFIGSEEEFTYGAIKMNVETINSLFHDRLIPKKRNNESIVATQIEIDTMKDALMNLISELIKSFSVEQQKSINNVNASMDRSISYLIGINIVSIVLGLITLMSISRIMSNHLKQVVNATIQIANGDLTREPLPYDGKDEIGLLSNAVNVLQQNMKEIIKKVKDASQAVTSSSELLMHASREVKEGSRQMVVTMDELASGAEAQANSASDLSEKMNVFVGSVQRSQADGEAVVKSSQQVLQLTKQGSALMQESVRQMSEIDHMVSESVEKVLGLDQKSEQISHLVDVVKDIADQTNLLALNAAIEAARAGEHGRGFAVVAEEVRKLAEEVAASVTEITNIVTAIQRETNEVVTTLNNGYKQVQQGTEQIEKTGQSFKTIEYFIQSMVESIDTVAGRLKEISDESEKMNVLITDIAAVSEEAAAGVEQSSAATQQTSSAMDEISEQAEQLAELAELLEREINVFKLESDRKSA